MKEHPKARQSEFQAMASGRSMFEKREKPESLCPQLEESLRSTGEWLNLFTDCGQNVDQIHRKLLATNLHLLPTGKFSLLCQDELIGDDALRLCEERVRSVLEGCPDAILLTSAGEIVFANSEAQSLFGMTEEEICRVGQAGIAVESKAMAAAIESREKKGKWRGDLTCRRKDGSTVPVEVSVTTFTTESASLTMQIVILRDTTKLKQAENEMQVYRDMLSSIADGIILVRARDGEIVYTNSQFDRTFGYGSDELLGRHMSLLNARSYGGATYSEGEIMDALRHSREWCGENCHVKKDGTLFWCHVRVSMFHHFSHGPVLIGILRDSTVQKQMKEEREKSELALRKREDLLRLFMDNSPAIAWIKNEKGRMVYLSKSFEDHFGANIENWIDKSDTDLWPPDLAENYRKGDLAVLDAGQPMEFMEQAVSPDGTPSKWMSIKFPLHVSGNRFVAGIGLDVSGRKNAEEELAEHRRRLEILLKEQTRDLEEKTHMLEDLKAAIRVMLQQRDEDRKELEERFLANMRQLVLPYAEKLKRTHLDEGQMACLSVMETHCQEIMSPFIKTLQLHNLTPTESQVSSLIKDGKTTKEIASILGVASSSIDTHRKSIRKKIGLSRTNINLVTYLRSLEG